MAARLRRRGSGATAGTGRTPIGSRGAGRGAGPTRGEGGTAKAGAVTAITGRAEGSSTRPAPRRRRVVAALDVLRVSDMKEGPVRVAGALG